MGMSDSARISLDLFREGKNVRAITEARGLSPTTVAEHLTQAILAGEILELGGLIAIEKQRSVEAAIAELEFRFAEAVEGAPRRRVQLRRDPLRPGAGAPVTGTNVRNMYKQT